MAGLANLLQDVARETLRVPVLILIHLLVHHPLVVGVRLLIIAIVRLRLLIVRVAGRLALRVRGAVVLAVLVLVAVIRLVLGVRGLASLVRCFLLSLIASALLLEVHVLVIELPRCARRF